MDFKHRNAQPFELGFDNTDKPGVLLIHGFTGSPSHMRPLGEALAQAGYPVAGILLPGHGLTLADMDKTGHEQWLNAAREAAVTMRKRFGRVIVGGLSMGGTLSLILGGEGLADCVISYAAPVRVTNRFTPLSRFIWPFVRYLPTKQTPPVPGVLHEFDYHYTQTPVRKAPDLMRLMRQSQKLFSAIATPLLIVQSHADETVQPVSAQMIYDGAVNASPKEVLWLNRSGHVLTIGVERRQVFEHTLAFLQKAHL